MSRSVAVTRVRAGKRSTAEAGSAPAEPRRSGEIIDAAARVFASKGFHGASTQDIADELGIRQASIYYYFPSKDVALEKVCLIGAEGFYESAKAIADGEGAATEKIARLCAAHTTPLIDRADEPAQDRTLVAWARTRLRTRHRLRHQHGRVRQRA